MKIAPDKASYKILLSAGVAPKDALDKALLSSEGSGRSFLKTLTDEGMCQEETALEAFSKATGHPVIDLKNTVLDDALFKRVPVKFASYYKFCPVRFEDGKLLIATSRVLDIHTLDEMRFALGFDVGVCFCREKDIEEVLQKHYGLAAETVEKILSETLAQDRPETMARTQEVEDIEKLAAAPSVAHVVNQIILDAYKKRASDIHLEPLPNGIRLRYRVDGLLHEAPVPPELKDFFVPMLSRIKIMANLNVAERRLPQDGKLRVKTMDETIDLRVSFIPTANGESVVIRILPGRNVFQLEQLGFEEKYLMSFKQLLGRHNGILFVTGPTGSGKSTTLYAALNLLNSPERKIITIEDPVEYELKGVSQIHVNPEIGLTFSNGLRSMLRQDPDVMMVGEVRDLETADIAIRAALTGHLILSTLHTNDAASGVTRLMDIGVEPYLIASSVEVFIAQRLVRLICPKCKRENPQVSVQIRGLMEREQRMIQPHTPLFHGTGCDHCSGTGYRGRIAIHEFLPLNESIRKLIMARATAETIKLQAVQQGMVTLRQSGWRKVLAGITTPEEILETTEEDVFSSFAQPASRDKGSTLLPGAKGESRDDFWANPKVVGLPRKQEVAFPEVTQQADFENLRKYKRIACNIPVTYRMLDYKGKLPAVQKIQDALGQFQFEGTIEDLSPGGVLFVTADHAVHPSGVKEIRDLSIPMGDILEAGNMVDLKIFLPGDEKHVECMAKILRVLRLMKDEKNTNEFSYHVAMLFLAIDSMDRSRLEKFCQANDKSDETI